MMPWQLKKGLEERRRLGRTTPRPICEQLPQININHWKVPRDYKTYTFPNVSFRYPQLSGIKITWNMVHFTHKSLHRGVEGPTQEFRIKQIRTGLGGYFRHSFICTCGKPVIKLYILNRHIACKRCCNAINASQNLGSKTRPVLQATRIQSFLDNKSRLFHRTQERLRKKLGEKLMMAQSRLGTRATGLWE